MRKRLYSIFLIGTMTLFFFGMSISCWICKPKTFSDLERRVLTSFPEYSKTSLSTGDFMEKFETYTQDQFPARDSFRSWKAFLELFFFQKQDYNGLFQRNGHLSKLDASLNEAMLDHAADCFQAVYDNWLIDGKHDIYLSIIPDKNYFLAAPNGYPSIDYDELVEKMREKTPFMTYLPIIDHLSLEDYYRTDTHWRQERIVDIAQTLLTEMNPASSQAFSPFASSSQSFSPSASSSQALLPTSSQALTSLQVSSSNSAILSTSYEEHTLKTPFFGVYCGQIALPAVPDSIHYLTNDLLDSCTVTCLDSGTPVEKPMYDLKYAAGKDPYEMFLSGQNAVLVLENPSADTKKELILFRDSFASSLAPLLLTGYAKITLVDLRYISSSTIGKWIEFTDQDVLFLYSTLILNDSLALK